MNTTKQGVDGSLGGVLSALLLPPVAAVAGALLGGLYVRLFVPKTGMGWDQLADALGGLMLGGLLGFAVGVALCFFLKARRRWWVAVALCGLSVLLMAGLWALRPPRPASEPVVREEPFRPWFRAKIRVGHSEDILRAVEPGAEPIPFTEAEVSTGLPELVRVGWGPELARCKAEPTREELHRLLPLVTAAAEESKAGACRTERDGDLGVVVGITLDGERSSARVEADCLPQRPALVALAAAMEEVARGHCGEG
jgi:hypothetical protein